MMETLKRYQNIILIVVVLILAFIGYSYFFAGKDEAVLQVEEVAGTAAADQDLISLLLELRSITLDETLFANPVFTSLYDFGQDLVPEPVGRVNPFAPLNASSASAVDR